MQPTPQADFTFLSMLSEYLVEKVSITVEIGTADLSSTVTGQAAVEFISSALANGFKLEEWTSVSQDGVTKTRSFLWQSTPSWGGIRIIPDNYLTSIMVEALSWSPFSPIEDWLTTITLHNMTKQQSGD